MSFLYVFALFCLMMDLDGAMGKVAVWACCVLAACPVSFTLSETHVTMKCKSLGVLAILFR